MTETATRELVSKGLRSIEQSRTFLGISQSSLYRLIEAGQLRYVRVGGRRLIPLGELERYAEANLAGGEGLAS